MAHVVATFDLFVCSKGGLLHFTLSSLYLPMVVVLNLVIARVSTPVLIYAAEEI